MPKRTIYKLDFGTFILHALTLAAALKLANADGRPVIITPIKVQPK